jgi:hypothetical protein
VADLQLFWEALLSEVAAKVLAAWQPLAPKEKIAIFTHLQRMANEEGWSAGQKKAAQFALTVIAKAQ